MQPAIPVAPLVTSARHSPELPTCQTNSATLGYVKCLIQLKKSFDKEIVVRVPQTAPIMYPHQCVFILVILTSTSFATELTFELPDSAKECFHQEIKKNTTVTLEFQVDI